jgi:hypothetical protein
LSLAKFVATERGPHNCNSGPYLDVLLTGRKRAVRGMVIIKCTEYSQRPVRFSGEGSGGFAE